VDAPLFVHGGRLAAAAAAFPDAPRPWIDLSTGISPFAYPIPDLPVESWTRLPDPADLNRLERIAAASFGVADAGRVVAVPGSEIGLRMLAALREPARVAIASPTYASHAEAWAGHRVESLAWEEICARLGDFDVVIVVHPNNPDWRVIDGDALDEAAERLAQRGGWLIADEAFADAEIAVVPEGAIRLRSFGKFFGLAGVRLGFVIADEQLAGRMRLLFGEWPVSGPAIGIAARAYADNRWQADTRLRLAETSERLDRTLAGHGWKIAGGTLLFRLAEGPRATALFTHLGSKGILVRPFVGRPDRLRFGLPGSKDHWRRLEQALASFSGGYR
jgi:cobalamin biosynthetic protein CobC